MLRLTELARICRLRSERGDPTIHGSMGDTSPKNIHKLEEQRHEEHEKKEHAKHDNAEQQHHSIDHTPSKEQIEGLPKATE